MVDAAVQEGMNTSLSKWHFRQKHLCDNSKICRTDVFE